MSYIVKNCPCFVLGIAMKGNDKKVQTCNNYRIRELTHCSDITDCVIKQVIEKYKKNLRSLETYIDIRSYECTMLQNILQLFDIEEINNK